MLDKTGKVVGASKIARDITERKQEEKAQLLLMGELSHRVKNTLATVQAIATQSLRRSRNPGEFVTGFTGRIQSLAKAHQMLSESRWEGVELSALVNDQVLLGIGDDRVIAVGPRLSLEPQPALHLAMVLHELGTNARKYGALSTSRGSVSIDWRVTGTADRRELKLHWQETGGPPVSAPAERGLGMILIEESLAAHGGVVTVEYGPEGLSCTLRLPLPSVKEPLGAYTLPRLPLSIQDQANRLRLQGKRILVVEDEPVIALEMAATLRDGGCEVVGPAGDVAGGLELLASGQHLDAALLDANLSGESVDELAAALTRAGVPFAFVTGYGAASLPPAFQHAPVISKPFGKNEVFSALAMLLQRRTEANLYQLDSSRNR
jgi:two-component sensor histidine kinase